MNLRTGIDIPFSAGKEPPIIKIPKGACDCHQHIFDPARFPYKPGDTRNQPPATVKAYRMLQRRLCLTRNVIVTPSAYGTDNRCTLDALKQMGENARAVIVADAEIKEHEIERMNQLGVCGVRFNIVRDNNVDWKSVKYIAEKIASFDWHLSFWMDADTTVLMKNFLNELPCQIVFDHRGHLPAKEGVHHEAFSVIGNLMKEGKAWVKLSALYHDSATGEPTYSDTIFVGRKYVECEESRVIWGTDWPHASEYSAGKSIPNDAQLLNLLAEQATERVRYKILVENPAKLYKFNSHLHN